MNSHLNETRSLQLPKAWVLQPLEPAQGYGPLASKDTSPDSPSPKESPFSRRLHDCIHWYNNTRIKES